MKVKVSVDEDLCTRCGNCYDNYPEIFENRGDDISQVRKDVGENDAILEGDLAERALEAAKDCPGEAIIVEVIES
jgi:ferredoxin